MSDYNVGERLLSPSSGIQLMIIRAPGGDNSFTFNGVELSPGATPGDKTDPADGADIQVGKRYEDPDGTAELLCVAGGKGELALNGVPLIPKTPKPLPASD